MDIPTCNYKYLDKEYYVKSEVNNNYIPYVFGFILSSSTIGLLVNIYNINLEYNKQIYNKSRIVLYIILIMIFLALLIYSGYKIGIYNTKNMITEYSSDELLLPCFSKYTKKIIGMPNNSIQSSNSELSLDVNSDNHRPNEEDTKTITTPYNTLSSKVKSTTTGEEGNNALINSSANSSANLGNKVIITDNSSPTTSSIDSVNSDVQTKNRYA